MATYNATWTAFNDGELSPLLDGRIDIPQYMKAGRVMLNMIPTVQGPMVRRGGTRLMAQVGGTVDEAGTLIPFVRSRTDAYLINIFNGSARFFFNGQAVLSGGVPYTIDVPYQIGDLYNADGTRAIDYAQSVDELFLTQPSFPTQVQSFFGATNWTIAPLQNFDGPWQDENTDDTNYMVLTGSPLDVGSFVAITASKPIFAATDAAGNSPSGVGRLIRIKQQDVTTLKAWYPGQRTTSNNLAVGDLRRSGSNTYQCVSVAPGASPGTIDWVETGSDTLFTTEGLQWDGPQDVVPNPATAGHYYGRGVQWEYEDCGYGVAEITVFSDAQHVGGIVRRQFPKSLYSSSSPFLSSNRWQLGAWSDTSGWPRLVTLFKQRLNLFGLDRTWMSVSGDFQNFADLQFGQVLTDSALTAQVLSDQLNSINWVSPQKTLLVGTTGGEFVISQQSISDPFGPTNFQIDQQSTYGGRQVKAVRIQTATLFVQENGRSLREFSYVFTSDAYQSRDLAPLSEHITASGIVDMAWSKYPYYIVWCVLANGKLIGFTYNPEQEVRCWHEHDLGGNAKAKCVATVPSADGSTDDVYLIVERDVSGVAEFFLEKIELPFQNVDGANQDDMFYVDCGITFRNTINATLQPGTGADVKGTTNVQFVAGSAIFSPSDVGRYIDFDWEATVINDKGLPVPQATKGHAQITQYVSGTQVLATIDLPWPNLDLIAANDWRMSVTHISSPPAVWETGTLSMLLDGAAAPDFTYSGGSTINLPWPASVVTIGLKSPAMWQSMRPEQGDPAGSAIGKVRRAIEGTIRVQNSLGVQFGPGPGLDHLTTIETRPAGWPDDTPPPLYSGNLPNDPSTRVTFDSGWDQDGSLVIYCQQPLPATICAVSALIDEES